ncbi:hypothetical protein SAMN05428976_11918 [Clostridium sp. USBA 49]|uniref:NACHT domain-containing protein n=1 Tax=Clostridium sp. USBA 49 TaxID=1881060 RepID=UPI000999DBD2|nr:hypothetical protein [Clostridium sp. USBA 49]SKA92244.1 hypothetical protein SAMN05428976_11918 [Clostridium sp. USBA 49]
MIQIDWRQFGRKFESLQASFEQLCHYLFCRELKITSTVSADHNQKGLETKPVKFQDKYYGYQAKFFEKSINYTQIKESIKNALDEFECELDYIFIYLNTGAKTSCDSAKNIVKMAKDKGVEIVWKDVTSISTMLAQPSNIDLAQAFFGIGDEFKFIKESTNKDVITLLQSNEYIDLPIIADNNKYLFSNLSNMVLKGQDKVSLFIGNPGSGKSICMHKFFQVYSGLNKKDEKGMFETIEKNNAVPMLINLKYCSKDSLENIIRNRQNDYGIREEIKNFIYLLDGLDEISENDVEITLHYIKELVNKSSTCKVIISSRKESINRILIKSYFPNLKEYTIGDLCEEDIKKYFEAKNNTIKLELLDKLKSENKLLTEIKDILLVKSLWDVIDKHNNKNCILDILRLKVESIIDKAEHQKVLNQLNIPNPKKNEIIELNKTISYEMQKKFVLNFSYKEIYDIVLNKYPRIDYKAANKIVGYLAESFFENNYNEETLSNFSYVYQHRRFQEYFFTLRLKEKFEKNPNILRELRVLSNRKFFEDFFLELLRKEYTAKNDIGGMLELNLINVYLGKSEDWGADDPAYLYSYELTEAIASQRDEMFESLMSEETLPIAEHLSGDIEKIVQEIEYRNSDKRYINRLPDPIQEKAQSIVRNIAICWQNGKFTFAKELDKRMCQLVEDVKLNNNKYLKYISSAIREEIKNYLYILLVIRGNKSSDVLENYVRQLYINDNKGYKLAETDDEKIIKAFFSVILDKENTEIVELINLINDKELVTLLEIFCSTDYLHYLKNNNVVEALSARIKQVPEKVILENEMIIAFKRYLKLDISDNEKDAIDRFWGSLSKERAIDLFTHKGYHQIYSFITVACDKYSDFVEMGFVDVRNVYIQLYKGYFDLLENKTSIGKVAKRFCDCNELLSVSKSINYKYYFSKVWASIFAKSSLGIDKLLRIKEYLYLHTEQISMLMLFCEIKRKNLELFKKIVDISEIEEIEKTLVKNGPEFTFSIQDNVNSWFHLAYLYSSFNETKSINCISNGINKGILRHGWRKDSIVDIDLINSLEIMVDNKFFNREDTKKIIKRIFNYLTYLGKITDESGDWKAFEKLLKITSRIDIKLAEQFLKMLEEEDLIFNELVTIVLIEKVYQTESLSDLQEIMGFYKIENDGYYGRRHDLYYLEKIKVFLEVLDSGIFEDEEEKKAFDKAYFCFESIKRYSGDTKIGDVELYNRYKHYCEVYDKKCNAELETYKPEIYSKPKDKLTDKGLKVLLDSVVDTTTLIEVYKKLNEPYVLIEKPETWRNLIDKTYSITSSLELFFDYLKNIYYLHFHYSSNSDYVHYAVAYAFSRTEMRQDMLDFIYKNSGHGGFYALIKVYEINGNKEQCIKLFNRFIRFCDFLVFA